jgi:septal ring factor EnvC (AmiA/AmiB activator)
MTRFLFLTLLACLSFVAHAPAADNLKAVKKNLATQEQQKKALQKQVETMESEVRETRGQLVEAAHSIQANERELKTLENRILSLETRKSALDKSLDNERKSTARLILALERLRRVPPEAMIARPGAPLQAAQSALLMKNIIPALYHQAETLREKLTELENISTDLKQKREAALKTTQQLMAEHRALSGLVEKREALFASATQDLEEQQENVRRISLEAQNLQDLVQRLDTDRRQARKDSAKSASLTLPNTGSARIPVTGAILIRYGEPDNFGAPSRGLTIEGRDQALVVAPMGGIVRFAGSFKNYGQMIIMEHENGYHSLIAGLQKIDTVVGQNVATGEPLGLLGRMSNGNKPTLYYELRLNGQPINPAVKFRDLG